MLLKEQNVNLTERHHFNWRTDLYLVSENKIGKAEEDYDERKKNWCHSSIYKSKEEVELYSRFIGAEIQAPRVHGLLAILISSDQESVLYVEHDQRLQP